MYAILYYNIVILYSIYYVILYLYVIICIYKYYNLYALQSTVHLGSKKPQANLNNQNENNSS